MNENVLTPALMYRAAAVVALLDVLLVIALTRQIGTDGLRRARWTVPLVSGVFWVGVWLTMVVVFWDDVYGHVFPAWARWLVPPVYGLGYAGVAALWRYLALRLPRAAVAVFVALWGLTGALTHWYAIAALGLLERPPMLQQLTPASAIVFATFEFGFYGCAILALGSLLRRGIDRRGG